MGGAYYTAVCELIITVTLVLTPVELDDRQPHVTHSCRVSYCTDQFNLIIDYRQTVKSKQTSHQLLSVSQWDTHRDDGCADLS